MLGEYTHFGRPQRGHQSTSMLDLITKAMEGNFVNALVAILYHRTVLFRVLRVSNYKGMFQGL
jgi:hypothetical protein